MSNLEDKNEPIRIMIQRNDKCGDWVDFIIVREYRIGQIADVLVHILELDKKVFKDE